MAFDPGMVYLVASAIVVAILLVIAFVCNGSGEKKAPRRPVGGPAQAARQRADNAPPAARRRAPRRRMVVQQDSDEEGVGPGDDDMVPDIDEPEGKIGAKKLLKLQNKAEKRRQREIELQEREEKKEREKKLEEQRKKEEAREKAEEELKAEEERLKKEEQEKREHEEFLKWKEMFSVDESGEGKEEGDLDSQSLLQEFINYIKDLKVVMLEDLAGHFKLKTQECIQRVQDLLDEGKLTGVIDDRGKFIYITMEELESVAKYIRQNGRVSIIELAKSSNRLINLNPDNIETQRKLMAVSS